MAKAKAKTKRRKEKKDKVAPIRATSMEQAAAMINERYGTSSFMHAHRAMSARPRRVRIGVPVVDCCFGGGVPRGKMLLLKGELSTAKTALALKVAAAFQRTCRICNRKFANESWEEIEVVDELTGEVFIEHKLHAWGCLCGPNEGDGVPMKVIWLDAESSFENPWSRRMGVSTPDVYLIQSEYSEQAIDVADISIRTGDCDLLVVDSIAAMTPAIEIEETAENQQMGVAARLMNKAMRKWGSAMNAAGMLSRTKTTVLMINQIRLKIGVVYGSPETTPGGKGIPFHASIIAKLKKNDSIAREDDMEVGQRFELYVEKNKTAPPFRGGEFDFFFADDVDGAYSAGDTNTVEQIFSLALVWDMIEKSGSWYKLPGVEKSFQGEAAVLDFMGSDEGRPIAKEIEACVVQAEDDWATGKLRKLVVARDLDGERLLEMLEDLDLAKFTKTMTRIDGFSDVLPGRVLLAKKLDEDDALYFKIRKRVADAEDTVASGEAADGA